MSIRGICVACGAAVLIVGASVIDLQHGERHEHFAEHATSPAPTFWMGTMEATSTGGTFFST